MRHDLLTARLLADVEAKTGLIQVVLDVACCHDRKSIRPLR